MDREECVSVTVLTMAGTEYLATAAGGRRRLFGFAVPRDRIQHGGEGVATGTGRKQRDGQWGSASFRLSGH